MEAKLNIKNYKNYILSNLSVMNIEVMLETMGNKLVWNI